MEFDFGKTVEEIVMQAKENQEEFIFETIRPYCEKVLQMKINKEELKQILLNSVQKQQPCKDCVSRGSVLDIAKKGVLISNGSYESVRKAINELPPVTPKLQEWLSTFNTDSATECFTAVQELKKEIENGE